MKKYLLYLAIQFIMVFILSLISYLLRPVHFLFFILIYLIVPFFSLLSACRLALKGINPYLTWILPGISETAAGFLITLGISPDPLPIMITFFVSLIGAAAGDVIKKKHKKGRI